MCMEDIKLGRALAAAPKTVTLTATTVVSLVGGDPQRTRLAVAGDGVNTIFLAPQGVTPANGVGIPLTAQIPYHLFTVEQLGKVITGPWQAFCQGAGPTLTVIDCSLERV